MQHAKGKEEGNYIKSRFFFLLEIVLMGKKGSDFIHYHLKVALSQKGLMHSSFLQTDKPNYFPEPEF